MACFANCSNDWDIKIERFVFIGNVAYYEINVRFGPVAWTVNRRYSEFAELADRLAADHGISKDSLPPKKILLFSSQPSEEFLNQRLAGLDRFLKKSFDILKATMPRHLVVFLAIDVYEIFYILETLSFRLSALYSPSVLQPEQCAHCVKFSHLEVHALTRVLKLPRPPFEIYGLRLDYCDIFEMCSKFENIEVYGDTEVIRKCNITPQNLSFDLSGFRSLKHLTLNAIHLKALNDASDLRQKLTSITVSTCYFTALTELTLCDQFHRVIPSMSSLTWEMRIADLSNNECFEDLDNTTLIPRVKTLNMNNNKISSLKNLGALKDLQHLNVSYNCISSLSDSTSSLTGLITLDLSGNSIVSLKGLELLTKLTSLNLSFNKVGGIEELQYVVQHSMLDNLVLLGNPITSIVDYRIKVLVKFGNGHKRITLDNEESTQKELDRVAVILALNASFYSLN